MRRLGVTFALALFLLGTLASEAALARGGGRGGGSHGAGAHGGGHRGGGGKHFHHGHGGKHFHPGHGRVGVFIGAPVVFGGWPYAWPYYYPPPVYYPSAPYYPPAYIERGNGQPVPQQEQPAPAYWYYCPDAKAYYPYVTECRGGWQQVAPKPPPPS